VIASPAAYNRKVGLALLWPITTQRKGYPFEVSLPADLRVDGVVLSDQLKSLDWRVRRARFICRVPPAVVREALERVGVLLDLGEV
jgi:mRNA interferase MazF